MDTVQQRQYFVQHLLQWYQRHQRKLPWRQINNPYYTWVSEIMLQQTRVDTVIPYFERFIKQFPTLDALADAPEEDVLKAWEGLGYYSRARNLQSAVQEVKAKYNSRVPDTKQEISSLKGVGPYTSGAILSIAFNKPEPAVDGNVMRVLSRYFLIEEDIMKGSTRAYMEHIIREIIPHDAAGDFNQALMELGALVCTPRSPNCLTCPVMEHCSGRLEGMEEKLPIKKKAKPPRIEQRIAVIVEGVGDDEGKILIRQRPAQGLLARMWELPHTEIQTASSLNWGGSDANYMDYLVHYLAEAEQLRIEPAGYFMDAEHTFSHIHWNMKVYICKEAEAGPSTDSSAKSSTEIHSDNKSTVHWISIEDRELYALPNVFIRILNQYAASKR